MGGRWCGKVWQRVFVRCVLVLALAVGFFPYPAQADERGESGEDLVPVVEPHVSEEVIVVYDSAAGRLRSLSFDEPDIGALGYEVTEELGASVDTGQTVVASIPEGKDVSEAVAELEDVPGVAYAQPNYEYSLIDTLDVPISGSEGVAEGEAAAEASGSWNALSTTNDPFCKSAGEQNQWYLWSSEVPQAWDMARCDGSVTVAVLDTGCRLDHEDLAGSIDLAHAYDTFMDVPLASSSVSNGDEAGHGTHVCGIVGARANNGVGIAGASFNAKVLPIKVFNNEAYSPKAKTTDVVQAYEYLRQLVESGSVSDLRVVNMSLGYYSSTTTGTDRLLEQSIKGLRDKGVLTVCAGGNGDARGNPRTDRSIPADFDECISVTSLDRDGGNTYWSDYNEYKDISAPGDSIYSTVSYSRTSYGLKSGTSMASPLVAGAACLLWAAAPNLTVDQVEAALLDNAVPVNDSQNDRRATSGSKGALDVEASVRSVMGTTPAPEKATVRRLAGETALGTMKAVSEQGFSAGSCSTVVVATLDGYWDALTASALAGRNSCPVLITDGTKLSSETAAEIKRLGARTVYIAGGPAAVSDGVKASISKVSGVSKVIRLAGDTAIGTSLEIYEAGRGSWGKTAIVATSETFQDALSAAPYAYADAAPVFLANASTHQLDARVVSAIKAGGFTRVLITGGTTAISPKVEQQLSNIACVRKGGATAYETSAAVAEWCVSQGMKANNVGVATGVSYYDALTGAALCGKNNAVLVLASDDNRSAITSFIGSGRFSIANAFVFGGSAAVSDTTYRAVAAALA